MHKQDSFVLAWVNEMRRVEARGGRIGDMVKTDIFREVCDELLDELELRFKDALAESMLDLELQQRVCDGVAEITRAARSHLDKALKSRLQ
jgi:hypothetical protein